MTKKFKLQGLLNIVPVVLPLAVWAVEPLPVEQVAPGIFVHTGVPELPDTHNHGAIANIGFVIGERCVAVIDSGGNPRQGYALKAAIAQQTVKPVCYVINTHVHPDHIYGNIAFKDAAVKFVGHYKLPRAMAMRKSYYVGKAVEQLGIEINEQAIIAPDITVQGEYELDLGQRVLILTAHQSAHTDNDLSVYDPQTDTLWLADLLFIDHIPVIDGSLLGWLHELDKFERRNYTAVIPGHGPVVRDWPKSMLPEKAYLTMLRDEIRAALKQGRYLEDAVKTVGVDAQKQWSLFEQFHRKNVTAAFAELEWED
ncbi:MAG: quinoprotein relay system zinc metallohydrolase 2 [Gammaproteobacteria bacterium]